MSAEVERRRTSRCGATNRCAPFVGARRYARTLGSLLMLGVAACARDATSNAGATDVSIVAGSVEHTVVAELGRRGTLRADSAVLGDRLETVRLIRPVLTVDTTAARPVRLEIAADSGTLEVASDIVLLMRPRRVFGAPPILLDAEMIGYDPAGDSLWAVPGGRVR